MRMRIATTALFGLLSILGGCSSPTDPGKLSDFDKVPTSIRIGGQSVELRTYAFTESDPSGGSLLKISVDLGLAPGLPGEVTGVTVDQIWVSVDDEIQQIAVEPSPIPESTLWHAVDNIDWDEPGSVEVVAQVRDQNGKQFFVRDDAVAIAHGDPFVRAK
jgi:hypothetical protein